MKRWHLGCLLLLVLGLIGCDEVAIPACYVPSLSLANPADLPGFTSAPDGSGLVLTNTAGPKTTFVLRPDIYSAPWAGKVVLSSHSSALPNPNQSSMLSIRADALMPLRHVRMPNYPSCDQPPAESSVPLTVIQHGESRELEIRIAYAYNKSGIVDYEGFAEEMENRRQTMMILMGIGIVVLTIAGIGAVYLIVAIISALATLVSKK